MAVFSVFDLCVDESYSRLMRNPGEDLKRERPVDAAVIIDLNIVLMIIQTNIQPNV